MCFTREKNYQIKNFIKKQQNYMQICNAKYVIEVGYVLVVGYLIVSLFWDTFSRKNWVVCKNNIIPEYIVITLFIQ